MEEVQIEKFLSRPTLKRLDDKAREELRSALRKEADSSLSDDVEFDMDSFEKNHRMFSESVIKPVLERYRDRQKQKHKEELTSSIYRNAKFKIYVLLAVVLFIAIKVFLDIFEVS